MSRYQQLYQYLTSHGLNHWVDFFTSQEGKWFTDLHHGDFVRWQQALDRLPQIDISSVDLSKPAITVQGHCEQVGVLESALKALMPWRKGPFQLDSVYIDTEWRSDYKWQRVEPHLQDLAGRRVLDIGCGNGYHIWRMLHQNPDVVIGIDPSVLFNLQFQAINHYVRSEKAFLLPLTLERLPEANGWFDTVFSMGVLYHRRSPFDHLNRVKQLLRPGGELCLETLVIDGSENQVLVPRDRYARMNNVWFIPSAVELAKWVKRAGFSGVEVVDLNQTTTEEQRSTKWMTFESLEDCLDPQNQALTVEGYPAPCRAVVIARR